MELEQRNFRADPLKLKRLRVAANMTVKDFQEQSGLNIDTVRKILRGDPVFLSSLAMAVRNVFDIGDPLEVLHPEELAALGVQTKIPAPGEVLEWKIENYLSGWQETSHGLQYQLVQLRHRYLTDRLARGKCYELRHLSTTEREKRETLLKRHPEVCERIGPHPHITDNLTAVLVDGLWWVLDRWEPGETLAERLEAGPLSDYELRYILTGIAKGLEALHQHQIVCRELSPASVLLRESDDRPILTDLDLAKMLDGKSTVSPQQWPVDAYRALEVAGQTELDPRADIYSWGRLFVHGANGLPGERGEEELDSSRKIPQAVREAVFRAVELLPSERPATMQDVLKVLQGWQ
ncbi:MAG: protein kinase [Planctomycetaceae bacterium]|nr:protein kinase [Planctomycetaceae bacterium]